MPKLKHTADILRQFLHSTRLAPSGCLEWIGQRQRVGDVGRYGVICIKSRKRLTHRVAWSIWKGQIPTGLHVLHTCDNMPCVNVGHLYLGTDQDNAADRDARGRHWNGRGPRKGTTPTAPRDNSEGR